MDIMLLQYENSWTDLEIDGSASQISAAFYENFKWHRIVKIILKHKKHSQDNLETNKK